MSTISANSIIVNGVSLDSTNVTKLQKLAIRGSDIASGSSINLTTATGDYITVTGTTTITSITLGDGDMRTVRFSGALILTNGASLILPTGGDITTEAGDIAIFRGEASSVVRCVSYVRADGTSLMPPLNSDENRVINGAFNFWQRGTSSSTLGYNTADRWYNNFSGGTVTMSRQSFAVGDALGRNSPKYFLRQSISGQTGTNYAQLIQRIEGVASYAGQTITLLGWVRRSSGTGNVNCYGYQSYGTGGSPSGATTTNAVTIFPTGSWAPFAAVFTVPSISGKTLGSNNDDHFAITLVGSNGTTGLGVQTADFDLWGIHIRVGTHTTVACNEYIAPELGPELVRCQRYYEKSYNTETNPGTTTESGCELIQCEIVNAYPTGSFNFAVPKRAAPVMTIYSTGTGASGQVRKQVGAADIAAGSNRISTKGFNAGVNNVSVTPLEYILFQWAADAEL